MTDLTVAPIRARYEDKLASLPPSGQGCHCALLGVANLGCRAGLRDAEILRDIRCSLKPGVRIITNSEIQAAINRARHDLAVGGNCGVYRPAASARSNPVLLTPAEQIGASGALQEKFRNSIARATDGTGQARLPLAVPDEQRMSAVAEVLDALFEPTDKIFIGTRYESSQANIKPVSEWQTIFAEAGKQLDAAPVGARAKRTARFCGKYPHICPNPLSGASARTKAGDKPTYRGDRCVADFRYFVVESDTLSPDRQLDLIFGLEQFGFPLALIIHSGGKSYHAWFRCVGIDTQEEWDRTIRDRLFPLLALLGADKACANPSRLSRTPGMYREEKGRFQNIIFYKNLKGENLIMSKKTVKKLEDAAAQTVNDANSAGAVEAAETIEVVDPVEVIPAGKNAERAAVHSVSGTELVPAKTAGTPAIPKTVSPMMLGDLSNWAMYFFNSHCTVNGEPMLLCWRDSWFIYEDHAGRTVTPSGTKIGPMWHEISDSDLRARITGFLREKKFSQYSGKTINENVLKTILCNLNSVGMCNVPADLQMPIFVSSKESATGWLVTQNSAINIAGLLSALQQKGEISMADFVRPLSPDLFCTFSVPYGFDPAATCPKFEKYLSEVQPNEENRLQLQLMAGLLLVPDTHFNVAFFLYGEGGTGKSVFTEMLFSMLGKENCCSVPLTQFSQRFRTIDLTTHLANICNDLSMGDGRRMDDITSIFKAVTSGETIPTERKYKTPRSAKAIARLVFTTNKLPRFKDLSRGVWDRMRIIPFNQRFRENPSVCRGEPAVTHAEGVRLQNPYLADELRAELSGILNWALAGAAKLPHYRIFPENEEGLRLKQSLQLRSEPIREFLTDALVADPEGRVQTCIVYRMYKNWAEEQGERPLPQHEMQEAIDRLFPHSRKARLRTEDGHCFYFLGVSLNRESEIVEDMVPIPESAMSLTASQDAEQIAAVAPAPPPLPEGLENPAWLADMRTSATRAAAVR